MILFSLLAALLTVGCLLALLPALKRNRLDIANVRSSHQQPTPRGGGLSFLIAIAAVFLIAPTSTSIRAVIFIALPLALVGWLDDRWPMPAQLRLGLQVVTAVILLSASGFFFPIFFWPIVVMCIVASINFINFMDGLDGLVASCMVIILLSASSVMDQPSLVIIAAALIAFLAFNWSPAQVFMGDVGSIFLGVVFAGICLTADSGSKALLVFLLASPLLMDASSCVIRRWIAGHHLMQAHRLHLYQRLNQAGLSHRHVALMYAIACILQSLAALFGGLSAAIGMAFALAAAGIMIDRRFALPFSQV